MRHGVDDERAPARLAGHPAENLLRVPGRTVQFYTLRPLCPGPFFSEQRWIQQRLPAISGNWAHPQRRRAKRSIYGSLGSFCGTAKIPRKIRRLRRLHFSLAYISNINLPSTLLSSPEARKRLVRIHPWVKALCSRGETENRVQRFMNSVTTIGEFRIALVTEVGQGIPEIHRPLMLMLDER